MTLPSEEVNALKRSHKFLTELIPLWRSKRWLMSLLFSRQKRELMVKYTYGCIKHFPFDCHIDRKWSDEVCTGCYNDKHWCRCDSDSVEKSANPDWEIEKDNNGWRIKYK